MIKQLSTWSLLKSLINTHEIGSIITRKEIVSHIKSLTRSSDSTIDTYRRQLTLNDYLGEHCRGQYIVLKRIPDDIITY